jgi:HEAT repeat protein
LRELATAEQITANARVRALWLLSQHGPEHLPSAVIEVVARSPGALASSDLVALLAGREPEVIPAFIALLQDERWAARMRAVEFLAHASDETAREALRQRLSVEADAEIRSALQSALDAERPL